jgi:hypothetical protein
MTTFNAKHWININCFGGDTLAPETVDVISNFTLMWNFFEGVVCDNYANIRCLERLSEKISQGGSLSVDIEDAVRFWAARYLTGAEFNHLFQGLRFRPNDCRGHVEAVLRKEKTDPRSKLLAAMIIIYRLRNNLFHGLKTIDTLNDQIPNLTMACRSLAAIVQASQAPIMIVQKAA